MFLACMVWQAAQKGMGLESDVPALSLICHRGIAPPSDRGFSLGINFVPSCGHTCHGHRFKVRNSAADWESEYISVDAGTKMEP